MNSVAFHRPGRQISVLIAIYCLCSSQASGTPVSLASRVLTSWQTRDGLPQQSVAAVVQTSDGYVWTGTQDGLARFDGHRFTEFNTANIPALAIDNIDYLAQDRDGVLWIAGQAGVSTMRAGLFHQCDLTAPPNEFRLDPSRQIWARAGQNILRGINSHLIPTFKIPKLSNPIWTADRDGRLWWSTGDGITCSSSTDTRSFSIRPGARTIGLAAGVDGTVWILSTSGLFRTTGSELTCAFAAHWKSGSVCIDHDGNVWVLADGNLSLVVDGKLQPASDFQGVRVDSASVNAGGDLVCRYGKSVAIAVNRTFVYSSVDEGLTGQPLSCLRDSQGDIWIGTDNGLDCIRDRICQTFTTASGLGRGRITSALVDLAWHVLVAEDDGSLYRYAGDTKRRFDLVLRNPKAIRSLVETADGEYLCIVDGVVKQISGIVLTDYRRASLVQPKYGRALSLSANNDGIWICGSAGVVNIRHGDIRYQSMPAGIGEATSTYVDHANRFWVAAAGSLLCFADGELRRYKVADCQIDAIFEDSSNNLWIGTRGNGLIRCVDGRLSRITRSDGLPSNSISAIFEDDAGNLWLGTPKEIFRVVLKDINAFIQDRRNGFFVFLFGAADGNTGGSCLTETQISGQHGWVPDVWFACQSGMVRVQPWLEPSMPCPVNFERAMVNGKSIVPGSTVVTVPPGNGDVDISFTTPDLKDPEHLQFAYRLVGFDDSWIDAGQVREAFFTNLAPGSYRFELKCTNVDGAWTTRRSFAFVIEPHFYQTLWFRLFSVIGITSLLFILIRHRIQRLQNHNRVLQELHETVAAQNDELLANQSELEAQNEELSDLQTELEAQNAELIEGKNALEMANLRLIALATTDGLTGLTNHRTFQEQLVTEWQRSRAEGYPLSLLLIDVDHFKRFNDEFGHQLGDRVLMVVSGVLQAMVEERDLAARYGGEEFAVILNGADAERSLSIAEELRAAIAQSGGGDLPSVTASIGAATATGSMDGPARLIEAADVALYASKDRGRNCVTHCNLDDADVEDRAA